MTPRCFWREVPFFVSSSTPGAPFFDGLIALFYYSAAEAAAAAVAWLFAAACYWANWALFKRAFLRGSLVLRMGWADSTTDLLAMASALKGFWALTSSIWKTLRFLKMFAAMLSLVKVFSMNIISFWSLAANCFRIWREKP